MPSEYLTAIHETDEYMEPHGAFFLIWAGEPYFFSTKEAALDWQEVGIAKDQLDLIGKLKTSKSGIIKDEDDSERGWLITIASRSEKGRISWKLERLESL